MTYEIKDNDLTVQDIEKLYGTNDAIFMPESDYGLGEICFRDGKYELYSIPMYGGEPQLEIVDSNAFIILNNLSNWC